MSSSAATTHVICPYSAIDSNSVCSTPIERYFTNSTNRKTRFAETMGPFKLVQIVQAMSYKISTGNSTREHSSSVVRGIIATTNPCCQLSCFSQVQNQEAMRTAKKNNL